MGVRAGVRHCPLTDEVFVSEWLQSSDARTESNRIAVTLKRLFILISSHKQGTVHFAHFYTRRPPFLTPFRSYVQFVSSLHNFY